MILLQSELLVVAEVLRHLLRIVTLIALIILVFGQSYSFLLLHIYGGTILTSASGQSNSLYDDTVQEHILPGVSNDACICQPVLGIIVTRSSSHKSL